MFRRKRRTSLSKLIGLVIFIVGFCIFLYVIPFTLWMFIFAFMCMIVGIVIYHF